MDVGAETLRRMRAVTRYNDWIFKKIQPFLGKRILEVGSGMGNFSGKLVDLSDLAVLTDCEEKYLSILEERFKDDRRVKIFPFDLKDTFIPFSPGTFLKRIPTSAGELSGSASRSASCSRYSSAPLSGHHCFGMSAYFSR